mmetsp:Transcript_122156/g.331719  ORF Transcript_122156/g.331719 Transcript_122156/m.331719 type:complete len:216 (+) Transcript_122156:138-785(+)
MEPSEPRSGKGDAKHHLAVSSARHQSVPGPVELLLWPSLHRYSVPRVLHQDRGPLGVEFRLLVRSHGAALSLHDPRHAMGLRGAQPVRLRQGVRHAPHQGLDHQHLYPHRRRAEYRGGPGHQRPDRRGCLPAGADAHRLRCRVQLHRPHLLGGRLPRLGEEPFQLGPAPCPPCAGLCAPLRRHVRVGRQEVRAAERDGARRRPQAESFEAPRRGG